MGTSYIAKDLVYTVCTNQLSASPQKLSNSRKTPTVFYGVDKECPLLNIEDRNIDKPFVCKSPWNAALGFMAFGAGLIVGALLLTNPVGWIIAAGAALVAIGIVKAISAANHKCTDPLSNGEWKLLHSTVKFNGSPAITRSSILICGISGGGGVLTPFFSYSAACKAADKIAFNNLIETSTITISSFFAGLSMAGSLSSLTVKGGLLLAGKFGAGFVLFSTLTWGEKEIIRGYHENLGELKDNKFYEEMNKFDSNDVFSKPTKPDDITQDITDIADIVHAYNSGKLIISDVQLANKLKSLDGLSRQVLRTNPTAQSLLADLNAGKYSEWKNQMRYPNANRMTPSMVEDGQSVNSQSLKNNAKNMGKGVLFALPFIGTLFSENARAAMAKSLAEDVAEAGLDVIADNPVD